MYIFIFSYLEYEHLSRLFAMHLRPNFLVLLYLCIFAFIMQSFELALFQIKKSLNRVLCVFSKGGLGGGCMVIEDCGLIDH